MAGSATQFAQLLREGIAAIAARTGQPKGVIRDELGYALGRAGGSAIAYWGYGDGHLPRKHADVEKLARELVRRGHLDREWLAEFLVSAGYPDTAQLVAGLFGARFVGYNSHIVQAPRMRQDWGDAPLVQASLGFSEVALAQADMLEEIVLEGYLDGLRDAGWRGDPRAVEFAYGAASMLIYAIGYPIGYVVAILLDESSHAWMEQAVGLPMESLLEQGAETMRRTLDLADRARASWPDIGSQAR